MTFSDQITGWYFKHHRALPWRKTRDPYFIWISEIILQQTRIEQGLDYYLRFITEFPDVYTLAGAKEEKVLKLWQGLGYYSRARHMHETAKTIVKDFNGIFPGRYDDLIRLKGIGAYTAAAILSIAFGQAYPVMDGNVLRVMARYLAISEPVDATETKSRIDGYLAKLIDKSQPGNFNQAMMELGALICKPKSPDCSKCPLVKGCKAFKRGITDEFPVKAKKTVVSKRYFFYLVIREKAKNIAYIYINKRTGKDIWKNLYDFPLIETAKPLGPEQLQRTADWKKLFNAGSKPVVREISEQITHKLSHRDILVRFVQIEIQKPLNNDDKGYKRIPLRDLFRYPVPRLIENYSEENFKINHSD